MKFARSLALLSALSLPLSVHAVTYTATATLTDLTTAGNVTGSFAPISFNDPPAGGLFNPFVDAFTVLAKPGSDGDELELDVVFTSPASGSGDITGDASLHAHRNSVSGSIDWDSAGDTINLLNGSQVVVYLPNFFGFPLSLDLSSCGANACGSSNLYVSVLDNDPPAPTPEPSSLAFLGTGALGLAGVVRRKLAV
ncbi:MAG TPA: PEP-CTERM sorting domain-containing protein [Acidobacteriaceae bacterium]|jgi:hypothetical protein|nr:PEP-CTERM sorting domain-containing protein [Acidobacteriaceae bacterium]